MVKTAALLVRLGFVALVLSITLFLTPSSVPGASAVGTSPVAGSPTRYPLIVVAESGGTVRRPIHSYEAGRVVTVTAREDSEYAFTGWTGAGNGSYTGTDNPATVTMNGPIAQIAQFAPIHCEDADGDGYGSSPQPNCVSSNEPDCDDKDRSVYPGAPQLCDGINNDCRHRDWPAISPSERDDDGDGVSECGGDCDDSDASSSADCSDGNANRMPDGREGPPPPPGGLKVR
jgi:hypothetical protein